jgi:hypothetical protein
MRYYRGTKLLLDPGAFDLDDLRTFDERHSGMLGIPAGKSVKDVVKDYMLGLRQVLLAELSRNYRDLTLSTASMTFLLTVPHTWSERAKNIFQTAVREARLCSRPSDRIRFVWEHDAALYAAFRSDLHQPYTLLKVCRNLSSILLGYSLIKFADRNTIYNLQV